MHSALIVLFRSARSYFCRLHLRRAIKTWSGARLMRRGDGAPRRRIQWQPPSGGSGFKSFLGKTAKFLITGTVFYIGVAFVTGGTSRLQSDANIIKVGPKPRGLVLL